jgi:SAM-dependent methyltransferase
MALESDSANFWKVASSSEDDYWRSYEATRPNYANSGFLDVVFDYHLSKGHSTSFNVAHDVGCGSGVVAVELASRFAHVVASDNNASSLDTARRFLAETTPEGKISFSQCEGEALAQYHPPQSADFISAAECLPLMDEKLALQAFATVLKPGGTLAVWFYARPHFSEPTFAGICQPLFDSIMDRAFSKVINGFGPKRTESWKKTASGMASQLDYLDFSAGQWKNVQRRKWNSKSAEMSFFTSNACDFEIEITSNISESEKVIEVEDAEMWASSWNIQGVKNFVDFCFPNIKELVDGDSEIQRLFEELAQAMGGHETKRTYTWPIVLILATRS